MKTPVTKQGIDQFWNRAVTSPRQQYAAAALTAIIVRSEGRYFANFKVCVKQAFEVADLMVEFEQTGGFDNE